MRKPIHNHLEHTILAPCPTCDAATSSEPSKVGFGVPPTHVHSHFTQEGLGYHHVYAVDARQVYSRDTLQFAAEIESWCIFSLALPSSA
jgi:hypothetical protein